jgi:hypothetical protein
MASASPRGSGPSSANSRSRADTGVGADTKPEDGSKSGSRLWPILITLGLVFVILVNAVFIYIAVSGADEVVPSYHTEER